MRKRGLRFRQMNQGIPSLISKGYVAPCKCGCFDVEFVDCGDSDCFLKCKECGNTLKMLFDKNTPSLRKKYESLRVWNEMAKLARPVQDTKKSGAVLVDREAMKKPCTEKKYEKCTSCEKKAETKKTAPKHEEKKSSTKKNCSCKKKHSCKNNIGEESHKKIMELFDKFRERREARRQAYQDMFNKTFFAPSLEVHKEMVSLMKALGSQHRSFMSQVLYLLDQIVKEAEHQKPRSRNGHVIIKKSYLD